jgi:PleD family two-component response regulator
MNPPTNETDKTDRIDKKTILVVINDIFFYTKVRDALLPQGYRLEKARAQQDIVEKTLVASPAAVLLDMNDRAIDAFQALETLKTDPRFNAIPVLAYASHEDVATWNKARTLGVDKVVTRNEMSARTKELVEDIINGPSSCNVVKS